MGFWKDGYWEEAVLQRSPEAWEARTVIDWQAPAVDGEVDSTTR